MSRLTRGCDPRFFQSVQSERGGPIAGNPNYDYRGPAETVALMFGLGYTVPEFATNFSVCPTGSSNVTWRMSGKVVERPRRWTPTPAVR